MEIGLIIRHVVFLDDLDWSDDFSVPWIFESKGQMMVVTDETPWKIATSGLRSIRNKIGFS